jgi:hypothetical protein
MHSRPDGDSQCNAKCIAGGGNGGTQLLDRRGVVWTTAPLLNVDSDIPYVKGPCLTGERPKGPRGMLGITRPLLTPRIFELVDKPRRFQTEVIRDFAQSVSLESSQLVDRSFVENADSGRRRCRWRRNSGREMRLVDG